MLFLLLLAPSCPPPSPLLPPPQAADQSAVLVSSSWSCVTDLVLVLSPSLAHSQSEVGWMLLWLFDGEAAAACICGKW